MMKMPEDKEMGIVMDISYFGYGANLNQEAMLMRCPWARFVSIGKLIGYKFATNTDGVATLIKADEACVFGAIWVLSKEDEEFLDLFEGVKGGWYTKEYLPIKYGNSTINCMIYIASNNTPGLPIEDYFEDILQQCRKYRFDKGYMAYMKSKGWML